MQAVGLGRRRIKALRSSLSFCAHLKETVVPMSSGIPLYPFFEHGLELYALIPLNPKPLTGIRTLKSAGLTRSGLWRLKSEAHGVIGPNLGKRQGRVSVSCPIT